MEIYSTTKGTNSLRTYNNVAYLLISMPLVLNLWEDRTLRTTKVKDSLRIQGDEEIPID